MLRLHTGRNGLSRQAISSVNSSCSDSDHLLGRRDFITVFVCFLYSSVIRKMPVCVSAGIPPQNPRSRAAGSRAGVALRGDEATGGGSVGLLHVALHHRDNYGEKP